MILVKEIMEFLESIAPFDLQEKYDNSGLLTGSPEMEATGILIALDAVPSVIEEAIELGCNVVLSHHPILFTGLKKLTGDHYVEKSLIKAIQNNIAIIAIHTNLDNVIENGVNSKIAEKLGISYIEPLLIKTSRHTDYFIGAGVLGYLDEPQDTLSFLQDVKKKMNSNCLKYTRLIKESVHKIAICGGSGSFLLLEAINKGADVFITSDIKYHQFFDANDQIIMVDIGHYESEQFTIELLYDLIKKNFRNFAAHYTKTHTNPIKYL